MNILKRLLLLTIFLGVQACNPAISVQETAVSPTSTSIALKATETPSIPTESPVPPTPSSTVTPLPFSFNDLPRIDSSNSSSLVQMMTLQSLTQYSTSLHWSSNNQNLYILKSSGGIEIWDIPNRKLARTLEGVNKNLESVGWYPEKNLVAYVDRTTNEISVWDLTNQEDLFNLGISTFPFMSANLVVWSPDGLTIVSCGWDNTLRIWNAETGEEIKAISSDSLWFESVAWSPDGAYIAAGHKDGTIYIINTQTWNIENKLYGHNSAHGGGVPTISWAPDGTRIASGGRDEEKVFIWNKSRVRLHEFHGQPLSVFGLSWSPDSRMIASSGEGQSVVITDISTGSELVRLENHQPNTYSVSWSPNGKLLATVTANGQIRIFGVQL